METITADFFTLDPVECARNLIGCSLFWKGCSGRIVETEAYRAIGDDACHTFLRPSAREFIASHKPGDAYVYLNYGVHWLFNILVKGEAGEGFVLIRALEPMEGAEEMSRRRGGVKASLLTAGPGRLTQALGIGGGDHGASFLELSECGMLRGTCPGVVAGLRIGITKAADLPWRFGDPSSACLSRPFK